jgi:hypothetical protein
MGKQIGVKRGSRIVGRYKVANKPGKDITMDVDGVLGYDGRRYVFGTVVEGMTPMPGYVMLRAGCFTEAVVTDAPEVKPLPASLVYRPGYDEAHASFEDEADPRDLASALDRGAILYSALMTDEALRKAHLVVTDEIVLNVL